MGDDGRMVASAGLGVGKLGLPVMEVTMNLDFSIFLEMDRRASANTTNAFNIVVFYLCGTAHFTHS